MDSLWCLTLLHLEWNVGSEHHAVMGCPEAFNVDNRLLDFGKDGERAQPRQDVDSWVLFTSESDRESAGNEGNALDGPFSVPTDDLEVLGDNFEKLMLDIVGKILEHNPPAVTCLKGRRCSEDVYMVPMGNVLATRKCCVLFG